VLSGFTERVSHLRGDLTRKLMMWLRAGANMADSLREDGEHHRKNYGFRCLRALPPLQGLLKRFSAAGTKPFRVGRLALCLGSLLILATLGAAKIPVWGARGRSERHAGPGHHDRSRGRYRLLRAEGSPGGRLSGYQRGIEQPFGWCGGQRRQPLHRRLS
jgi:hypothetical protein